MNTKIAVVDYRQNPDAVLAQLRRQIDELLDRTNSGVLYVATAKGSEPPKWWPCSECKRSPCQCPDYISQ